MKIQNTKDLRFAYNRWKNSTYDSLWTAYENPSDNKVKAWEYCKELCSKYNGKNLKVIGRGTYAFNAGFIGTVGGKETFVFITKDQDRGLVL